MTGVQWGYYDLPGWYFAAGGIVTVLFGAWSFRRAWREKRDDD